MTGARLERVLIVEDRADSPRGHYAPQVCLLARGVRDSGHQVVVLTSLGLHPDHALDLGGAPVRRYSKVGRALERAVRWADGPVASSARRRRSRRLTVRVRSVLMVAEIRMAARALGGADRVGVIGLGRVVRPLHAFLLMPSRGRWVLYRHSGVSPATGGVGPLRSFLVPLVERAATMAEGRRRARGGVFVVAGPYAGITASWQDRYGWLRTAVVPLPVDTDVTPVDREVARKRLDLTAEDQIALLFGSMHPGKDPDTVWAAWCLGSPPPARLLAAGHGVRDHLDAWLARHPEATDRAILVHDGYIDETTKRLLFSAADLGICSFRPQFSGASATLTDFAAYRRPICCASGGNSAELTAAHDLGEVFDAGDADSLTRAISILHRAPGSTGLATFVSDRSATRVGQHLIGLLGI